MERGEASSSAKSIDSLLIILSSFGLIIVIMVYNYIYIYIYIYILFLT